MQDRPLAARRSSLNVCSNYFHHRHPRSTFRDYVGEIQLFGVFCAETGGVYLIPINDVEARRTASLRITAPRNKQRKHIRYADRYEVGRVTLGGPSPPNVRSGRVNQVVAGD